MTIAFTPLVESLEFATGSLRRVLRVPTAEIMASGLKNAPSFTFISTKIGQVWVLQTVDYAITEKMARRSVDYLEERHERLTWQQLGEGLAEQIELPSVVLLGPLLPNGLSVDLVDSARLVNVLMSNWLKLNPKADVTELRKVQSQLSAELQSEMSVWLSAFIATLKAGRQELLGSKVLMDSFNAMTGICGVQRRQFFSNFPALAQKTFSHDAAKLWLRLRDEIDDQKSPIAFLCEAMHVSRSTIRSMQGVRTEDLGYFEDRIQELFDVLEKISPEHRPKTHEHWQFLSRQYSAAKALFGGTPTAKLIAVAQTRHELKFLTGAKGSSESKFNPGNVASIKRLRIGLISGVMADSQAKVLQGYVALHRRGEISRRVDAHLGALSWKRVVSLRQKWDQNYAIALEKFADEIHFFSGTTYIDFLPDGKFVAPNGFEVRTLLSAKDLRAQGRSIENCLANAPRRYQDECVAGKTTILGVFDPVGKLSSTAELGLQLVVKADQEDVTFSLVQHTAQRNASPSADATHAVACLQAEFCKPRYQQHAVRGILLANQRMFNARQSETLSAQTLAAGAHVLHLTLGDRAAAQLLKSLGDA
jgi:hypothetical protein